MPSPRHLRALSTPYAGRETFVCGPGPFMDAARQALKDLDVPRRRIHVERFVSLAGNPFEAAGPAVADASAPAGLAVELDDTHHTFDWPRQTKLLDLLLEKGLNAPYSCRAGQCSACACRIVSGEVKMLNNEILDSDDIADGIVLACQSLPLTDDVAVTYE
jgi:3-ketosteroid 9alpha-monooxygenase subunit B